MDLNTWVRIKLSRPQRRLTVRLLYLEKYLDESIEYQREVTALLQRLDAEGILPEGATIPAPPALPKVLEPD